MPSLFERLLGEETPDEQVDLEKRQDAADERLRRRVDADAYGIEECAVTGVAVVNEGPDGEPVVVPIARFSLGEDVEDPQERRVWELVPEALRALRGSFEDVFVRHYDVQFTFAGDGLLEAEECRRVAVTPMFARRVAEEPGFGGTALRDALFEAHDIDDDIAPVAWGECKDYTDTTNAAVVTGGGAAAAAGGSAASCAGAGGGGAGGGAC